VVGYYFDEPTQLPISRREKAVLRPTSMASSGQFKLSLRLGAQTVILETTREEWEAVTQEVAAHARRGGDRP